MKAARVCRLGLIATLWGCSSDLTPPETGRYVEHLVHTTGATLDGSQGIPAERGYSVWLPAGYDPTVAHRTVFVAPTDTLFPLQGDPSAIYVGLEPSPGPQDTSARSPDWEYFALVAAQVERTFNVDRNDAIVAGTGSGATLASLLGCAFSKADPNRPIGSGLALRAQFSVAGRLPAELPACAGPIATLWIHDTTEGNPPTETSASLERLLVQDRCEGTAIEEWPIGDLGLIGCDKYTGCPADTPVVFCEPTWRGREPNYVGVTGPLFNQFLRTLDAAR
jgi:hypothetical protein